MKKRISCVINVCKLHPTSWFHAIHLAINNFHSFSHSLKVHVVMSSRLNRIEDPEKSSLSKKSFGDGPSDLIWVRRSAPYPVNCPCEHNLQADKSNRHCLQILLFSCFKCWGKTVVHLPDLYVHGLDHQASFSLVWVKHSVRLFWGTA